MSESPASVSPAPVPGPSQPALVLNLPPNVGEKPAENTTNPPIGANNKLAASFEWLVEDEVTCAVCLDLFEDPVTIKCGHNFCNKCVQILVSKPASSSDYVLICPLCRIETPVGSKKEDTNFPKNTKLFDNVRRLKEKEDALARSSSASLSTLSIASAAKPKQTVIPRSIKLLDEYDASIGKDATTYIPLIHTGYIGYGLNEEKPENADLTHWRGIIIAPQESPIGQLIYNVQASIPPTYPTDPPVVSFVSPKIAMKCVDEHGRVTVDKIELVDMESVDETGQVDGPLEGEFFAWDPAKNLADVLVAIRENMHTRDVCNDSSCLGSSSYDNDDEEGGEEEEEEEEDM